MKDKAKIGTNANNNVLKSSNVDFILSVVQSEMNNKSQNIAWKLIFTEANFE